MRTKPYTYLFRLRHEERGGHTHVRVFAGKDSSLGKCGDLVFRNEEWAEFARFLKRPGPVEVLPEEERPA